MGGERGERGVMAGLEGDMLRTEGARVVLLLEPEAPAYQTAELSTLGGVQIALVLEVRLLKLVEVRVYEFTLGTLMYNACI